VTPPSPPPLVLASASPRRRALLEQLGIPLRIDPAHLDENVRAGEAAERYVLRLAQEKADAVHARHPHHTVLAADTSVVLEGAVGAPAESDLRHITATGRDRRRLPERLPELRE